MHKEMAPKSMHDCSGWHLLRRWIVNLTRLPAARAAFSSLVLKTAWQTVLVFVSTLAIQLTTFGILAVAAMIMPAEAFARLSLIVAATMLANAVVELGLNTASTKMYCDTKDEGYLRSAFAVYLACLPIIALSSGATAYVAGLPDIGLGIALGGALNLWNAVRASDQARQDYHSFGRASMAFALLRLIAGGGTLYLTRDPVLTAVATFALPVLAGLLSASARFAFEAFSGPRRPVGALMWYTVHVYCSTVLFIAIPYISQFIMAARLNAEAIGSFGLILAFCGPISLLVYSLRSVLFPIMLGSDRILEDLIWSWKGLATILCCLLSLMCAGVIVGQGMDYSYGHKFPGIGTAFLIYFAGFSFTSMVGLYGLSQHTQGVPQLSSVINLIRVAALAGLLSQYGMTLNSMIAITAVVMCSGEVALAVVLGVRRMRLPI